MQSGLWLVFILTGKILGTPGTDLDVIASDRKADGVYAHPNGTTSDGTDKAPAWRLVRSSGGDAGSGDAAILRTADFERSDPRLAGLMLRCSKAGIETVIVVIEPFPPQSRPQVRLASQGEDSHFVGTIIPSGAGIRLPGEATDLLTGSWRFRKELEIKVAVDSVAVNGTVSLTGLPEALASLNEECIRK